MLDGIDGSGKSTIIKTWQDYLHSSKNNFFDLTKYFKKNNKYPKIEEMKSYKFIISSEPTYVDTGKILREDLLKNNNNYPAETLAEAFSLDRQILYQKIIIPCLKDKKHIIQDRGISTTLAYQPLTNKKLTVKYLSNLSGNKTALKFCPDYLVILKTSPDNALKRLCGRKKQDNAIFEKINFLKKLDKIYQSKKFQKSFTDHGTKILYLDGNKKIDIMKEEALNLLSLILK